MNKQEALAKLQEVKKDAPERKFTQSVDFIVNLKDIDLKKTEQQLDFFITLHYSFGRTIKTCALVGPELLEEAKKNCDHAILAEHFKTLTPKDIKHIAREYDFFIAQANVMPQVAQTFGKILGPRGKMPNPKAGCVVPPKTALAPLVERLGKTVRVLAKKDPVLHLKVGTQTQDENEVADNIAYLYTQIVHHLPLEENNIKNRILKLTMSKTVVW